MYLFAQGKDDLRQDAVMQQVFGMVNHLLSREADTRGRHLLVRTYKVSNLSREIVDRWLDPWR